MCIKHLKVKELKNLCKERNIKGYSKLKKQELINLLKPEQEVECKICETEAEEERINELIYDFMSVADCGWYRECITLKNHSLKDRQIFLNYANDAVEKYNKIKDIISKRHRAHWFYAVFFRKELDNLEEMEEHTNCKKEKCGFCETVMPIKNNCNGKCEVPICVSCIEDGQELYSCSMCNTELICGDCIYAWCNNCSETICNKCHEKEEDCEYNNMPFCHSSCVEHYKVKNNEESEDYSDEEEVEKIICRFCKELKSIKKDTTKYGCCEDCENSCIAHHIGSECECEICSNFMDCDEENKGNMGRCNKCYDDRKDWCAECILLYKISRDSNEEIKKEEESEEEEESGECEDCGLISGFFTNCNECNKEFCNNCLKCSHNCSKDNEEEEEKDLSKLKVKELKAMCKEKGLKRYSKLKKQQLLDLLKPKEEEGEIQELSKM